MPYDVFFEDIKSPTKSTMIDDRNVNSKPNNRHHHTENSHKCISGGHTQAPFKLFS
jgi:hypothetical protein